MVGMPQVGVYSVYNVAYCYQPIARDMLFGFSSSEVLVNYRPSNISLSHTVRSQVGRHNLYSNVFH